MLPTVPFSGPTSENDMINVIGYDIIQNNIVNDIREATFYLVLAKEVSSHNIEHFAPVPQVYWQRVQ